MQYIIYFGDGNRFNSLLEKVNTATLNGSTYIPITIIHVAFFRLNILNEYLCVPNAV